MLRVITLNVNGIRSAERKGVFEWLKAQHADVICLQELKAQAIDCDVASLTLEGYTSHFHFAEKKGYSGVGIYTRYPIKSVISGLGFASADQEGRYLELDLGFVSVASLYMPSGTSGEERQSVKFDFLNQYEIHLKKIQAIGKKLIICGDWNIAHTALDLKNWRANQKNSGFLPEERQWMDKVFGEMGFVDAFRVVDISADQYTWWSNRGRAYEKNVGWRIDYQVITENLKNTVKSATIYKAQRFSDHAPLIMDYGIIPH